MPQAADIIRAQWAQERANPRFDPREPRVSCIGLCAYRQVSHALGLHAEREIPWVFAEAGHLLQWSAYLRIKEEYPDAEFEISVETVIPGVLCHVDIIIPSLGYLIEVKSQEHTAASYGKAHPYNIDQVLMQWVCFQHSGRWTSQDGKRAGELVPRGAEVFVRDRITYGHPDFDMSNPVRWDPNRAAALRRKFEEIHFHIETGIMPEKPRKREPDCYFSADNHCPLFENCWR